MIKDFKACPPFVTDIDLSVDDKYLYVCCWGTGDFHQYNVSDPLNPKLTGKLRIGGVVSKAPHPSGTGPLSGMGTGALLASGGGAHEPLLAGGGAQLPLPVGG